MRKTAETIIDLLFLMLLTISIVMALLQPADRVMDPVRQQIKEENMIM